MQIFILVHYLDIISAEQFIGKFVTMYIFLTMSHAFLKKNMDCTNREFAQIRSQVTNIS